MPARIKQNYPFEGFPTDRVNPRCVPPMTKPRHVTHTSANRLVNSFLEENMFTDGGECAFAWVICAYCEANSIPFKITRSEEGMMLIERDTEKEAEDVHQS